MCFVRRSFSGKSVSSNLHFVALRFSRIPRPEVSLLRRPISNMGACSSKKSADAATDTKPIPASGEEVATVPPTKIAIGLSDEKLTSKPQDVRIDVKTWPSEAPTAADLAEADAVAIRVIALALTMRKTEVAKDAKAVAAPCPKSAAQAVKPMDPKLTVLVNDFAKQSGVPHMREALCAALAAHGAMEPPRVGSPSSSEYSRFPKKTHERSPQHFVPVSKAQERFWGRPQVSLAKVAGSRLTKVEADLVSVFTNLEPEMPENLVVPNAHSSKPAGRARGVGMQWLVNEFAKQSGVPHMREALCAALAVQGAMEPPLTSPTPRRQETPSPSARRHAVSWLQQAEAEAVPAMTPPLTPPLTPPPPPPPSPPQIRLA